MARRSDWRGRATVVLLAVLVVACSPETGPEDSVAALPGGATAESKADAAAALVAAVNDTVASPGVPSQPSRTTASAALFGRYAVDSWLGTDTGEFIPRRDWLTQTRRALVALRALPEGATDDALVLALAAFDDGFAGFEPTDLALTGSRKAVERRDLFVPNVVSEYHLEDQLEELLAEDPRSIGKFAALQLPMRDPWTLLRAPASGGTAGTGNAAPGVLAATPSCTNESDDVLERATFARGRMLLLVDYGCVIGSEGGSLYPAVAAQLLAYDDGQRLRLVAGFGQVTLMSWRDGRIVGGVVASGFATEAVRLKASD